MRRNPRWIGLGLLLLLAFFAAVIGGIATASSVGTWYLTLVKPRWNPPAAVFAPVWTLLYILMSIAAWRVWLFTRIPDRLSMSGHCLQLVLNASWSVLFFGMHSPTTALLDLVALWTLLGWLQVRFWRRDPLAGLLWLPYFAWGSFALSLNFAIWRLNPAAG